MGREKWLVTTVTYLGDQGTLRAGNCSISVGAVTESHHVGTWRCLAHGVTKPVTDTIMVVVENGGNGGGNSSSPGGAGQSKAELYVSGIMITLHIGVALVRL